MKDTLKDYILGIMLCMGILLVAIFTMPAIVTDCEQYRIACLVGIWMMLIPAFIVNIEREDANEEK